MSEIKAFLYSEARPDEQQFARFENFLRGKYGKNIRLEWVESFLYPGGFRLEAGDDVYDWSVSGRLDQLKRRLEQLGGGRDDIIPLIRQAVEEWSPEALAEETGRVLSVGDGIVSAEGLAHVQYGEIVIFDCGVKGMVQDLRPDMCGIIVFGDCHDVTAGSVIHRTGKTAGIPVGSAFVGRVVDALGQPIDGEGEIEAAAYRPIECPAPGIIDRQPVNKPMETGLLVVDSMFPIGRGQRELIIGDRQTGKTAIAVDAILNQKGKGVVCIYVAIGQKAGSVARLVETLRKNGAMDYTIVLNAGAGESAPMQYIAPYAGCAMAEYFMYAGRDVLIVYDDLSKHAVAYRTLSLLLERAPGREAYPGDVFYLHSRLLERAAHLSDELGGGSITALPIVETQAGDVSAYIPTNVISITDGQIFLQPDLFHAGIRPAIDVGLSVSRVGGAAQSKAMRQAAAGLKLRLAQFQELRAFARFGSDLDEVSRKLIRHGETLTQLLVQQRFAPLTLAEQCVLLQAAKRHMFDETARTKLPSVRERLLAFMHGEHEELMQAIEESGRLDEERMERALDAFTGCDEPE